MKQDHRPWDMKTFQGGANTDAGADSVARSDGTYRDAKNMRLGEPGNAGQLTKIGGESVFHSSTEAGASTYMCVGSISVKGRKFSVWASSEPTDYPPLIQIDGITMVKSAQLPYLHGRKIQLDCSFDGEGMVFDARSGSVPLHWDVGDIIRAYDAGEQTYFGGLDLSSYQVTPTRTVQRPVFTGFETIGGGGGVKPGQHYYFMRPVNDNGDRAPDGPEVGPVMAPTTSTTGGASPTTPVFPTSGITGANGAQVGSPSGFGVKLTLRVDNRANFQSMEVVRMSYVTNTPEEIPEIKVCKRFAIQPGENTVYDIVDTGQDLDDISNDENVILTFYIKKANSVRYVGHRLVYGGVELGGKDVQAELIGATGDRIIPFTANIGRYGHADPLHHCYRRRFQSGEKYGVGIVYVDSSGGTSYVQPVDQVQMPNRRTPKTGESLGLSDQPCYAANIHNEVSPTYEVFDLDVAEGRSQDRQVVNIMKEGRRKINALLGPSPGPEAKAQWNSGDENEIFVDANGYQYGVNNDGAYIDNGIPDGPYLKTIWGKPLQPTRPIDVKWGLDYRVNTAVDSDGVISDSDSLAYDPKVFNVRQHTLGAGFRGLVNAPEGMQGFQMVITQPARRVVAQGLARWALHGGVAYSSSPDDQPGKDLNRVGVCLPDFNAGALNQSVWEDIFKNPQRYRLQVVSPLGFCTQQFGSVMARDHSEPHAYSSLADILSIARVLWDNGQINPGNDSGGITPGMPLPGADHFTGFGCWRNDDPSMGNHPWGQSGSVNGDDLFGITSAYEYSHPSGVKGLSLTLDRNIYQHHNCNSNNFHDQNTKNFHEPWYVVNIIQEGVEVDELAGYRGTNHYQMFRSWIGDTNGFVGQQSFRMACENLDDYYTTGVGQERFIHVLMPDGWVKWLYIGPWWGQYANIVNSITTTGSWTTPGGEVIHGIYNVEFGEITAGNVLVSPRIVMLGPVIPPEGCAVEVRYDNRVPVKFYGDKVTSPAFASIVDGAGTANGVEGPYPSPPIGGTEQGVHYPYYSPLWYDNGPGIAHMSGLPIPFSSYHYNDRYMVPFGLGEALPSGPDHRLSINQHRKGLILSIRQWKVLFDCEVDVPLHFAAFVHDGPKAYPAINYVPRPYNFNVNNSIEDNGVFGNYASMYADGPSDWHFGGLKDKQEVMLGYMQVRPPSFWKKAEFAFEEQEDQPNAVIWSEKDGPLQQDSPGLKTFPVTNIFYIPDNKGKIQRLFHTAGAGNLYAVTEGATYELFVERSIAHQADGSEAVQYAIDNFIGGVVARSLSAGMPEDFWQTAAEGSPETAGGKVDALSWYDGITQHLLAGGVVSDIANGLYRKGLSGLYTAQKGVMSGAYDGTKNELYVGFPTGVGTWAGGRGLGVWQGRFGYRFDDYLFHNGRMYGHRGLTTFLLDSGDTIMGQPVKGWVKIPSAPYPGERMEWLRVKVNSPRKPTRIEWYDETDTLVAWMDHATFGPLYLKKVTDWEQWVPVRNASVDPKRKKIQGSIAYYRIMYDDAGDDKVVHAGAQVKPLK